MKKLLLIINIAAFLISPIIFSQTKQAPKNPLNSLSGTFALSTEGGITVGFTDYRDYKIDYIGKASVDYFFPSPSSGIFGFRVIAEAGFVGGKDSRRTPSEFSTKVALIGGSFTYALLINEQMYPYLSIGLSSLWFYPRDNNGNKLPGYAFGAYNTNILSYNGELGLRVMLSDNLSLNFSGGVVVGGDDYLDDIKAGSSNDLFYTATTGLSFYLGRNKDTDGDGIPDTRDMCPNTLAGVIVDGFGCPLDGDNDGVPDYLDKCSNTPAGVKVDSSGCPLDSDGDGVPDYLDKCDKTPAGVRIDEKGCPVDADGDGVPDYMDKCPNTRKGIEVDATGCPLKKEKEVVVKTKIKALVLNGDTNFEFGKASLLPNAYPVLDSLANTMKTEPKYRWRVEGHTDAIGSESYNMELSRKRAQSVVDYLVNLGVDRNKLEVVPYGESKPIASNKTAEGRAMNRRVEIKVMEKNK